MANGNTYTMCCLSSPFNTALCQGTRKPSGITPRSLPRSFDNAEFEAHLAGALVYLWRRSRHPSARQSVGVGAKTEVQHALARDPHNSYIYGAELSFFPSVGHWAEREKILLDSPVVPKDALAKSESDFQQVGRSNDAVSMASRRRRPNCRAFRFPPVGSCSSQRL